MLRILVICFLSFAISGCGYYLTPRPPVAERKLGQFLNEKVGTLATAPDYRVVYVKIDSDARLCAEAPADAAGQFAATFAGALSAPSQAGKISAEAEANMAVAMKQLFRRSQGVQLYRDGAFALCNLYLNDGIDKAEYLRELSNLRMSAEKLISEEIPLLNEQSFDRAEAPTDATNTGAQEKNQSQGTAKQNDSTEKDSNSPPDA